MTRSIPWLRVFVEGVVIVGSILLAFGIDAWWEGRQEREDELGYVERLRAGLAADTARFSRFLRGSLEVKIAVLRDFQSAQGAPLQFSDADAMMDRLIRSGFAQLTEVQSEAFREMENTGNLGLVQPAALRENLAAYYARHELMSGILEDPPGRYGRLLEGALPGGLWYSARIDSTAVDRAELERGVRAMVSDPELEEAINSELAYATSLAFYSRSFAEQAADLLLQLSAAYPEQ